MLAGLREDELQLAFVARPTSAMLRGLRFEELTRDPVCLAVAVNHPLARRRTVTLADAGTYSVVLNETYTTAGKVTIDNFTESGTFTRSGNAITLKSVPPHRATMWLCGPRFGFSYVICSVVSTAGMISESVPGVSPGVM